jgi:hypothetical protein
MPTRRVHHLLSAILLGLVGLTGPGSAPAQGIPAALGWHELPNTKLKSVCPPNRFNGSQYDFTDHCIAIPDSWNSGVMDTRRNRLVVWGGGHNDYLGNELYAVDLTSLKAVRLTDPGLPLAGRDCPEALVNGQQPNSRHTYDGIAYVGHADRLFVFSGALSPCGSGSRGTWTFNFEKLTWERRNPSGPIPAGDHGVVTAYDPATRKVFLHDSSSFYSYTIEADRYERRPASISSATT